MNQKILSDEKKRFTDILELLRENNPTPPDPQLPGIGKLRLSKKELFLIAMNYQKHRSQEIIDYVRALPSVYLRERASHRLEMIFKQLTQVLREQGYTTGLKKVEKLKQRLVSLQASASVQLLDD